MVLSKKFHCSPYLLGCQAFKVDVQVWYGPSLCIGCGWAALLLVLTSDYLLDEPAYS